MSDAKPAYVDLQVNGYGGVDFNKDDLSGEELQRCCQRLAVDGTATFLATVITEDLDKMAQRLRRLADLREQDALARKMMLGFHIEGPFINEENGYKGAHPADAIRPAQEDEMKRLLDAAQGLTKLVTLAPERDAGLKVTRLLAKQGILVSAGHCNPSLEQLEAALDAGVSMFTHLGNGCPAQLPRHDHIVQRVLSFAGRLWICFIADGVHVPYLALRNYLKVAGLERTIVVTDAIAPAGLGPGLYTLGRWQLKIGEDMVARAPDGSHLVGSAISMPISVERLMKLGGLSHPEALKLTAENPRRALGLL